MLWSPQMICSTCSLSLSPSTLPLTRTISKITSLLIWISKSVGVMVHTQILFTMFFFQRKVTLHPPVWLSCLYHHFPQGVGGGKGWGSVKKPLCRTLKYLIHMKNYRQVFPRLGLRLPSLSNVNNKILPSMDLFKGPVTRNTYLQFSISKDETPAKKNLLWFLFSKIKI